jgi:hypothetical protein
VVVYIEGNDGHAVDGSMVHRYGVREGNRSGTILDFKHKEEMIPLSMHGLT